VYRRVKRVSDDPLIDAIMGAVDRSPDVVVLRVHLAQLLFDRSRYAEGIVQCGIALLRDPTHEAALRVLERCAVALTTQARFSEAKRAAGNQPSRKPTSIDRAPEPKQRDREPNERDRPPDLGRGGHGRHYAWDTASIDDEPPRDDSPIEEAEFDRLLLEVAPAGNGQRAAAPAPNRFARTAQRAGVLTDRAKVVHALVDFTECEMDEVDVGPASFTAAPDANQLILDEPFAFLLGVLFDQCIPAEDAWRAPYDLQQRLGHLDPFRIAKDHDGVRRAISATSKLFADDMSARVVSVARFVCDKYGGDVSTIWRNNPTARDVQDRLGLIPGVGTQKAAMAVQMLRRDCGAAIRDVPGSDIAYDMHARRVLLRTGLANADDLDHMFAVVRDADPTRGAGIGLPAWQIGRTWCRAEINWCESCPVSAACPKRIEVPPGPTAMRRAGGNGAALSYRIAGDCA
jgi:uncharacterized HhH-GPD family protein